MSGIPLHHFSKGNKLLTRPYTLPKFMTYLSQLGSEEFDKNSRLKLMFVGDENQGKTSLLNCFKESILGSLFGSVLGQKPTQTIATNGIAIEEMEVTSLDTGEYKYEPSFVIVE